MTLLQILVSNPKALVTRMRIGAPEPVELRRAVSELRDATTEIEASGEDVAILQARIAAAVENGTIEQLSRRDVREGCKAFFHSPTPPAADAPVGDALLGEVERLQRRAAFFALIDAYLDAFDDRNDDIVQLASKLTRMSERWPWRASDHWPARIKAFSLFDPAQAPTLLARTVLATTGSAGAIFEQAGLDTSGRRNGGLVESAFRAACDLVSRMTGQSAIDGQRRLIDWARDDRGEFGYKRAWPEFVQATLAPWELVEPSEAHKTALIEILERFGGGDPRARPERWRTVMDRSPGAYAVLLRWLTRASVLQFLDVVDRSMPGHDAKLMWSYRRAFWTSYLMGDGSGPTIDAAWVAFGQNGARLANRIAKESGDRSFSAFGLQNDKAPDQAALIIQMGDLLIVDWSHSAKYNVWRKGDKGRPALFKERYRAGELYSAPLQESHSSPSTYSWQKRLARIIEGRVFISEKPSWRPKRA